MKYLFLILLIASGSLAHAQTPGNNSAGDVEAAREHFRKGKTFFDLQRYREAAHEYEAAYEAKNDPALLFNIAQSYRLGGEHAAALGAYKSFLRNMPNAPNRVEVEKRISDLQALVDEDRRNREAPPQGVAPEKPPTEVPSATTTTTPSAPATTTPAPSAPTTVVATRTESPARKKYRALGLGLVGGGAALVVAGAVLTGLAYGIESSQTHPSATTTFDPSAPGRMQGEQIGGGIALGVGIAAAATGAVVYFVGGRR